jgi:HEAT repeat protein
MFLIVTMLGRGATAKETFEGWNLEPSVGQAHLIMVARVVSVSSVRVVEGAKTDVALREYRFQPVKRLKGIFQRDTLAMTSTDLGLSAEDATLPSPLKEGEFRLLILTQQRSSAFGGVESYGCVSASPGMTTFEQRVPLVSGPDDPLVGAVETLIKVVDSRSRQERAKLLLERLATVDGVAAVPLLTSLKLRSDWAATDSRGYAPAKPASTNGNSASPGVLAKLARSPSVAVRAAALDVLREMLESRQGPADIRELDGVAIALRETLESDEANTGIRVAALDALGNLLNLKRDYDWARDLLAKQLSGAATHAERSAAATALSRIADPHAAEAIHDALASQPLDEVPARETIFVRAARRSNANGSAERTEELLLERLKRSIAARQSLGAEIEPLARMRSKKSLPLLLEAADQTNLGTADRREVAWALGWLKSDDAVPVLVDWVRRDQYGVKEYALAALENIDSPLAAREVRPLLKTEAYLPYKLQIARILARHGFADGYPLATEHLADHDHMAAAVLVLAALGDPRTTDDLSAIVAERPDRRWYAATLTGLAATGNADARQQLLQILNTDRNPMATEAAEAIGLVGDAKLLPPLARLVQSRNRQIASASLLAVRRYLSDVRNSPRGLAAVHDRAIEDEAATDAEPTLKNVDLPTETRDELAKATALLAVDAYIDADVRQQALAVARQLRGAGYNKLLAELADQAELEGSQMLTEVQAERRRMHTVVRTE